MQVNSYNFLRWFDGTADPAMPTALPNAYWQDRSRCAYAPIAIAGEVLSFYINSEAGLNISNFSDLRLSLHRAHDEATIGTNLASLFQNLTSGGLYNIYSDLTLPVAENGLYFFKIYRNSNGAEVLRSSYVQYLSDAAAAYTYTTYVKFRHDRYFYGIRYGDIPAFHQQFRINLSVIDRQVESDKEVYAEITTGHQRTFQNYLSLYYKVETYYLDPEAHLAAALMFEHDALYLNTKRYRLKSSYKEITNVRSKVSKGEAEVYFEEFSSANRC